MSVSQITLNKLTDKLFNEMQDGKYLKRFRDMYYLIFDFLTDNKINICIDEFDGSLQEECPIDYEELEPAICCLTVSLFCSLQATSHMEWQKDLPKIYFTNFINVINNKPVPQSYISLFERIKKSFDNPYDKEEADLQVLIMIEKIVNCSVNYKTSQMFIHNLLNNLFSFDDCVNEWSSIGFHTFRLSVDNLNNKDALIKSYLSNLINFNLNDPNKLYYSKGLYRDEFEF